MNDAAKTTGSRYALLDELRGLALISMIGYHAMWDLVYMFGLYAPWYGGTPGFLWQQATSSVSYTHLTLPTTSRV